MYQMKIHSRHTRSFAHFELLLNVFIICVLAAGAVPTFLKLQALGFRGPFVGFWVAFALSPLALGIGLGIYWILNSPPHRILRRSLLLTLAWVTLFASLLAFRHILPPDAGRKTSILAIFVDANIRSLCAIPIIISLVALIQYMPKMLSLLFGKSRRSQ